MDAAADAPPAPSPSQALAGPRTHTAHAHTALPLNPTHPPTPLTHTWVHNTPAHTTPTPTHLKVEVLGERGAAGGQVVAQRAVAVHAVQLSVPRGAVHQVAQLPVLDGGAVVCGAGVGGCGWVVWVGGVVA